MLRQITQAASPELQQFVEGIFAEESRFRMQDRRSVGREALVRPAEIISANLDGTIRAVTKDISGLGIGLIAEAPVPPKSTARIKIHRLKGQPSIVLAECRWCEEHIGGWFLSGWTFSNIEVA